MEHIDFFKLQAKNFLKDFKTKEFDENKICQYKARFFPDIDEIILDCDINEHKPFSLMNSQHIIAILAGFSNWQDLIHANKYRLELGKLLFENRNMYDEDGLDLHTSWQIYEYNNLNGFDDESKLDIFNNIFLNKE